MVVPLNAKYARAVIVGAVFSLPESPVAIAFLIIALLLYCLVPVLIGASISAFSGVLYYRLLHRARP